MEPNGTPRTEIRLLLDALGSGNTVVKDAMQALQERGIVVKKSTMYNVVNGRSERRELVEALLEAAEAETNRRVDVRKRAAAMVERLES